MQPLELSLNRTGDLKIHDVIDFGEWDIERGGDFTIYVKNPNSYAKASIEAIENSDKRVQISFPSEIKPNEVAEIHIKLPAIQFESEEEERDFFRDVVDRLHIKTKWRTV